MKSQFAKKEELTCMAVKIGPLLAGGAALAASASAITFNRRYSVWKRQQLERLQSESTLLPTARGLIEYKLEEGDNPVVVILHGAQGGYDTGIAYAHAMGLRGSRILAFSRPGYLRTPVASGRTPEEAADLYAAALDALAITQVVVVAISAGGPSGLQFALRHPERCRGLVMVSALPQRYTEEEAYQSLPWEERLRRRIMDGLIWRNPVVYVLHALTNASPERAEGAELLAAMSMSQLRKAGTLNDMAQFAQLPTYPVQDIITPTLVMHGRADTDIPFDQAQRLARAIPHAQLKDFEGDHIFMLSQVHRADVSLAFRTFLQELTPQPEVP